MAQLKALDRCPLITDKDTAILDFIPCVMVILLHSGSRAVISTTLGRCTQMDRWKDGRTDRRYETYYLPCFAVDKEDS